MKLCRFCREDFKNKEELLIHIKKRHTAVHDILNSFHIGDVSQ